MAIYRIYSTLDDANDKLARFQHKHPYLSNGLYGKAHEKALKEQLEGKEGKASKDFLRKAVATGAAGGGVTGGLLGHVLSTRKKRGAIKGAAIGAVAGGALDYGLTKLEYALRRKKIGNKVYDHDRWLDNMKVADGEMTESEFNKKWKNNKKK